MYYKIGDSTKQSNMSSGQFNSTKNIISMLSYCNEVKECRRKIFATHFNESTDNIECNKMCDNCERDEKYLKETDQTKNALELVNIFEKESPNNSRTSKNLVTINKLVKKKKKLFLLFFIFIFYFLYFFYFFYFFIFFIFYFFLFFI